MSPDARLIASALVLLNPEIRNNPEHRNPSDMVAQVARVVAGLEAALPPAEPLPGIRGMVPVAYLKDILQGVIARIEAGASTFTGRAETVDDALSYAKRRLADVEQL